MAIYVDFVGLNTLIQEPVDTTTNEIGELTPSTTQIFNSDGRGFYNFRNTSIKTINPEDYLVALNTHRNGPYGYPIFRQIRNSDNAVIRKQRINNTFSHFEYPGEQFTVFKGNVRQVVSPRRRPVKNYTEVPVVSKHKPLKLAGQVTTFGGGYGMPNLKQEVEVYTTLGNQTQYFSNTAINNFFDLERGVHNDYENFIHLYLEGGIDGDASPIDAFSYVRYSQVVYPRELYTYTNTTRNRANFVSRYWRTARSDRTNKDIADNGFGFPIFSQSAWVLDGEENFKNLTFNITPGSFVLSGAYNYITGANSSSATSFIYPKSAPGAGSGDRAYHFGPSSEVEYSIFVARDGVGSTTNAAKTAITMDKQGQCEGTFVFGEDWSIDNELTTLFDGDGFTVIKEATKKQVLSPRRSNNGLSPYKAMTGGPATTWQTNTTQSCLSWWMLNEMPYASGVHNTHATGTLYCEFDENDKVIKKVEFLTDDNSTMKVSLGTVFTSSAGATGKAATIVAHSAEDIGAVTYKFKNILSNTSFNRFDYPQYKWNHYMLVFDLIGSEGQGSAIASNQAVSASHFQAAYDGLAPNTEERVKLFVNGEEWGGTADQKVVSDPYMFLTGSGASTKSNWPNKQLTLNDNKSILLADTQAASGVNLAGSMTALSPYTATGMSFAYWMKFGNAVGVSRVFNIYNDQAGNPWTGCYISHAITSNNLLLSLRKSEGSNDAFKMTVGHDGLSTDTWYHIAGSLMTGSGNMEGRFWVNGAEKTTVAWDSGTFQGKPTEAEWGALSSSVSLKIFPTQKTVTSTSANIDFDNVSIDEFAFWTGGLTAGQVTALYNGGAYKTLSVDDYPPTDQAFGLEVISNTQNVMRSARRTYEMNASRGTTYESRWFERNDRYYPFGSGYYNDDFQANVLDGGTDGIMDFACWFKCTDLQKNTRSIRNNESGGSALEFTSNLPNFDGDYTSKDIFISFWIKPNERVNTASSHWVFDLNQKIKFLKGTEGLYMSLNGFDGDAWENNYFYADETNINKLMRKDYWTFVTIQWNGIIGPRGAAVWRFQGEGVPHVLKIAWDDNPTAGETVVWTHNNKTFTATFATSGTHNTWQNLGTTTPSANCLIGDDADDTMLNLFTIAASNLDPYQGLAVPYEVWGASNTLEVLSYGPSFSAGPGTYFGAGGNSATMTITAGGDSGYQVDQSMTLNNNTEKGNHITGEGSCFLLNTSNSSNTLDASIAEFVVITDPTTPYGFKDVGDALFNGGNRRQISDSYFDTLLTGSYYGATGSIEGTATGVASHLTDDNTIGPNSTRALFVSQGNYFKINNIQNWTYSGVASPGITISFWVKGVSGFLNDGSGVKYFIKGHSGVHGVLRLHAYVNSNLYCYIYYDDNTNAQCTFGGAAATIDDGDWHHICLTSDLTTDGAGRLQNTKIWIDGVETGPSGQSGNAGMGRDSSDARDMTDLFFGDPSYNLKEDYYLSHVQVFNQYFADPTALTDALNSTGMPDPSFWNHADADSLKIFMACSDLLGDTTSHVRNRMNKAPDIHTHFRMGSEAEINDIPIGEQLMAQTLNSSGSYATTLKCDVNDSIQLDGGPRSWLVDTHFKDGTAGKPEEQQILFVGDTYNDAVPRSRYQGIELTLSASGGGYALKSAIGRATTNELLHTVDNYIIPNKWYYLYAKYTGCTSGQAPAVDIWLNGVSASMNSNVRDGSGNFDVLAEGETYYRPTLGGSGNNSVRSFCGFIQDPCFWINNVEDRKNNWQNTIHGMYTGSPYIDTGDSNLAIALKTGYMEGSSLARATKMGGEVTPVGSLYNSLSVAGNAHITDAPKYLGKAKGESQPTTYVFSFWFAPPSYRGAVQTICSLFGDPFGTTKGFDHNTDFNQNALRTDSSGVPNISLCPAIEIRTYPHTGTNDRFVVDSFREDGSTYNRHRVRMQDSVSLSVDFETGVLAHYVFMFRDNDLYAYRNGLLVATQTLYGYAESTFASFNHMVIGGEYYPLQTGAVIDEFAFLRYTHTDVDLSTASPRLALAARLYNGGSVYDYNVESTLYTHPLINWWRMGEENTVVRTAEETLESIGEQIDDQSNNGYDLVTTIGNKFKISSVATSTSDLKAWWTFNDAAVPDPGVDNTPDIANAATLDDSVGGYDLTVNGSHFDGDFSFDSHFLHTLKWKASHDAPNTISYFGRTSTESSEVLQAGTSGYWVGNPENIRIPEIAIYSGIPLTADKTKAKTTITVSVMPVAGDKLIINKNPQLQPSGTGTATRYIINFVGAGGTDSAFSTGVAEIDVSATTTTTAVATAIYTMLNTAEGASGNVTTHYVATNPEAGVVIMTAATAGQGTYDLIVHSTTTNISGYTIKGQDSLVKSISLHPSFGYRRMDDTDFHRNIASRAAGVGLLDNAAPFSHHRYDPEIPTTAGWIVDNGAHGQGSNYDLSQNTAFQSFDNDTEALLLDSGSYITYSLKNKASLDLNYITIEQGQMNTSNAVSAFVSPSSPQALIGGATGARSRFGPGILQNNYNQFSQDVVTGSGESIDPQMSASCCFFRRHSLTASTSFVAPHSGFLAKLTASHDDSNISTHLIGDMSSSHLYLGSAKWETGDFAGHYNTEGSFVFRPKAPFYDTYKDFIADARPIMKDYGIVPEFKMSEHVAAYLAQGPTELRKNLFNITGGLEAADDSSKEPFYRVYSTTDFLKHFEIVQEDHSNFVDPFSITLRCSAVKKFLPYEGFYPAQRTVQIAQQFNSSYGGNINITGGNYSTTAENKYGAQYLLNPLFSPGILYNTIKSGVAVDYPLITDTASVKTVGSDTNGGAMITQPFDTRIPFEALMEPEKHLANLRLSSNEPDANANTGIQVEWGGQGDELYHLMISNFLTETAEFFLENKSFTTMASLPQGDANFGNVQAGRTYMMRLKMFRTISGTKDIASNHLGKSYGLPHDTGSMSEAFTMYSRPSAFGPPQLLINQTSSLEWAFTAVPANDDTLAFKIGVDTYTLTFDTDHDAVPHTAWQGSSPNYTAKIDPGEGASNDTTEIAAAVKVLLNSIAGYTGVVTNTTGSLIRRTTKPLYDPAYDIRSPASSSATYAFRTGSFQSSIGLQPTGWSEFKFDGTSGSHDFSYVTGSLATSVNNATTPYYGGSGNEAQKGYNYPFTPPYYHGEAWADITYTPVTTGKKTLAEIVNNCSVEFYRYFESSSAGSNNTLTSISDNTVAINDQAMQLASSVNIFSQGVLEQDITTQGASGISNITNVQVDTDVTNKYRWIIQTKFETPILNFNEYTYGKHTTSPATDRTYGIELPGVGPMQTPIGMWHQYGKIPQGSGEGVFLQVDDVPKGWLKNAMHKSAKNTKAVGSLASLCGFSTEPIRLGELDGIKQISEAVVAIPFFERDGRRIFFRLKRRDIESAQDPARRNLVGETIIDMTEKMKKFVIPPPFDFVKHEEIEPFSMYIFEFTHNLNKQDLADIWQNLPPRIHDTIEASEVSISHELLSYELLGEGAKYRRGQNSEDELIRDLRSNVLHPRVQWMVFKVKQRAKANYFEKIFARNESQQLLSERLKLGVSADALGRTQRVSFNWPYDFFSLIEGVKLATEVDFLKVNEQLSSERGETITEVIEKAPTEERIDPIQTDVLSAVSGVGAPTAASPSSQTSSTSQKKSGKINRPTRVNKKSGPKS